MRRCRTTCRWRGVHGVITVLEGAFKVDAPEVDRLLIHPEPATDNRR